LCKVNDVDGSSVDDDVPHAADEPDPQVGAPDDRRQPEVLQIRIETADV
jgi:hypothetical protein